MKPKIYTNIKSTYLHAGNEPATVAISGDYADLENKPLKIGDLELDASLKIISNLTDPQDDLDAVSRAYVDDFLLARENSLGKDKKHFNEAKPSTTW